MNIKKPIDYLAMYRELNTLLMSELPQMELYCKIGRLVSSRSEKGAAVAAAEYLSKTYPDISGFSPRNLRRMRDFYRAYQNAPEVLAEALTIGWTQNVVILEAELALQEQIWYIQAARQFRWSKSTLIKLDFMPIGQEIKQVRESRGMTREQLSEMVDYVPRHIQALENEGQTPSVDLLFQLATMFGVSLDRYIFKDGRFAVMVICGQKK